MTDRLDDETRRIPASMLMEPPDFDVSDEPGLPGEFVDVASLIAEVVRLRATIEQVRAQAEEWRNYQPGAFYPEASAHANAIEACGDALIDLLDEAGPAGADRHNCAQLRATIERVAEALAGDDQAVLKVADAQQVLIDADRQEQP